MTAPRPAPHCPGSVTCWIPGLRRGDQQAIEAVWRRYFEPLARLAEGRLPGGHRRAGDGEDVAVEAFLRFWEAVQAGRFPDLASREDVVRVLVLVAVGKATDFVRHEGHHAVQGESALGEAGCAGQAGAAIPAEFQAQVADLLTRLPDEELREIARLRLAGHTNAEIATALGRSVALVELKVARIRGYWKAEGALLRRPSEREEAT